MRYLAVSALLVAGAVLGSRALLARILPEPARAAELLGGLAPRPPLAPVTLLRTPPPPPEPRTPRGSRLAAILESGRLRVGFDDDSVPWAFVNAKDEVVGFDAEMAHSLALQLGVRLEFVLLPRDLDRILEALDAGVVDVIMSGARASTRSAARVAYSQPYAEEAVAFLVEDHRREEFATIAGLRGRRLRIGAAPVPEWLEALQRALPDAEIVPVMSIREFVEKTTPLDAMLTSWERACAWSLLHPEFAPVALEPRPGVTALAYVLPRDEPELRPRRRHLDRRRARLRALRLGAPVLDPRAGDAPEEAALVGGAQRAGLVEGLSVGFRACRVFEEGGRVAPRLVEMAPDELSPGRRRRPRPVVRDQLQGRARDDRPGEDPEALPAQRRHRRGGDRGVVGGRALPAGRRRSSSTAWASARATTAASPRSCACPATGSSRSPRASTLRESMILGTAGFTAALAVVRMELNGQQPDQGPDRRDRRDRRRRARSRCRSWPPAATAWSRSRADPSTPTTCAASGRPRSMAPAELELGSRPLEATRYGGVVDNVGGELLAGLVRHVGLWGQVACIGMASSPDLATSVFPLILRGVSLLGVSSGNCPMPLRHEVWTRLGADLKPPHLGAIAWREVPLDAVIETASLLTERRALGRMLVGCRVIVSVSLRGASDGVVQTVAGAGGPWVLAAAMAAGEATADQVRTKAGPRRGR